MMAEQGLSLAHTTIIRWIQRYVPEFEKRWNCFTRPAGQSWRVDETYVKIKGHLYRRSTKKERPSISCFAPSGTSPPPRRSFARLSGSRADCRIRSRSMVIWLHIARRSRFSAKYPKCKIRSSKYLNNLIEQDHRSIKLRLGPMLGLKHFRRAATTIAGIELMHRIRRSVQTGPASHQKQNRI
jgi:transposase-like protein